MSKVEELNRFVDEHNGYLVTGHAVKAGFTKPVISKYIKDRELEKLAHGIYGEPGIWPDELYILQLRNTQIVYSGETALYLHGLTDREYAKITFAVPQGYNVKHMKNENIESHYLKQDIYQLGISEVESMNGNRLRCYNRERCICDLVKYRKHYEVQCFQTAMKEYMADSQKNLNRLLAYAEQMKIRDELMKYVEVML